LKCDCPNASLESFAHETNILYELNLPREIVTLKRIVKELKTKQGKSKLLTHLLQCFDSDEIKKYFEYRNSLTHGFVYPIGISDGKIFVPSQPRTWKFSFGSLDQELSSFCTPIFKSVDDLIRNGWKCFSADELTTHE
jgi:hypothetical protein